MSIAIYLSTIALLVFIAFYERNLEQDLIDSFVQRGEGGINLESLSDLDGSLRRQRAFENLPQEHRRQLTTVRILYLLIVAIFVVELIVS